MMETTTTETTTMEKMIPKNQFQIYFLPIPDQKRHRNLFRVHPGNKAALSVPWCAHCKRVETGVDYLVYSDTRYFGGLGPFSLHLIYSSDLVKFTISQPIYTVLKILLSSISWYLEVFTFEPFLESFRIGRGLRTS
jgi:hypothetical protein